MPGIVGGKPLRLITSAAELHPSASGEAIPVDLVCDGSGFAFTTEFRSWADDGTWRIGVDRWHIATGERAALSGRPLHRSGVPG
jgi:hypothetical protein